MNKKAIYSVILSTLLLTSCGNKNKPAEQHTTVSVQQAETQSTTTTVQSVASLGVSSELTGSDTEATTTVPAVTQLTPSEITPLDTDSSESISSVTVTSVPTETADDGTGTTVHTKVTEAEIIDNATGKVTITFGKVEYNLPATRFELPDKFVDTGEDDNNPIYRKEGLNGVYIKQYIKDNKTYRMTIDVSDAMKDDTRIPNFKICGDINFGSSYKDIKKQYGEADVVSSKLKLNKENYTIYEYDLIDTTTRYVLRFSVFDKKGIFAVDLKAVERDDPVITTTTTESTEETTTKSKDTKKEDKKEDKKGSTTTKKSS